MHALVGENGAGKSTLARILAGSTRADSGAISIDGEPVAIASPLDAQRLGIGIIYQELDLFPNLTRRAKISSSAICNFRRPAAVSADGRVLPPLPRRRSD